MAVTMLSLADWRATRGPLTNVNHRRRHERVMLKLVDYYFKEIDKKPLPRILDGYDIMKQFGLKPSPVIGQILDSVREEQALGHVNTKAQAYLLAKKILKGSKDV